MTDRIVQILARQREQQVRESVLAVVKSLDRLVFTVQLKELEAKVADGTELEKSNAARVLENDVLATKLLGRRFAEEWHKEAMAAVEKSAAELRAEFPDADTSGDLAFFDGIEEAIALLHAKVLACIAHMHRQLDADSVEAERKKLAEAALANIRATNPEPQPFIPPSDIVITEELREHGIEPPDMREIRELGADQCDLDRPSDPGDESSEPF
jgi:hypothetical protein